MPVDFSIDSDLADLRRRVEKFITDVIIPAEPEMLKNTHGIQDEHRTILQAAAREAGLLSPHVGVEWGGLGLDMRGRAVIFETAGHSLLGPLALNCAAPDEGNMHLLGSAGERRGSVMLHHDRARSRRGRGPVATHHYCHADSPRLGHQRY